MTPLESSARLAELGYAIAIHPANPLARAPFAMLEGLCELNGANHADYAPAPPADFFNLVGMAEWRDLDEKLAGKEEAASWASRSSKRSWPARPGWTRRQSAMSSSSRST